MTEHHTKVGTGLTEPAVFAGPVAPRCHKPLRWSLLVGVVATLAALIFLRFRKMSVGPPNAAFPCELRLGSDEFAGLTVIGDLHGDYPALLELLRHAGLIQPAQTNETTGLLDHIVEAAREGNDTPAAAACSRWLGAPGHTLVQLGDNVDRGPGAAAVVACLRACQNAARAAGGKVVRLVGNHEIMWFQGGFRYAHDPGDPPYARSRLVSNWTDEVLSGAVRGAWATGPLLFVHAGLRPAMLDRLMLHGSAVRLPSARSSNATLASRVAERISVALAAAVAKCASANGTTMATRRRCLTASDRDGLLSAGPDRRGRGLGGPFWTDWSVLRRAEPSTSWMSGVDYGHKAEQWIWPPASVRRGTNGVTVLAPSESNTFIQIVGHTPARCNARDDDRCEPIRARADLAAIVADAGISEYYGGNRAYIVISAEAHRSKAATQLSRGHHLVSIVQGPGGEWRRHDLTVEACGEGEDGSGQMSHAPGVVTEDLGRREVFDSETMLDAIPLGPG